MTSDLDTRPSSYEITSGPVRAPLTTHQRDVWVSNAHLPDHPQFTIMIGERFEGTVNLDLLRACVLRSLLRHQNFHLRFAEEDGRPYQWAEINVPHIETMDLTAEADPAAAFVTWRRRVTNTVFPLNDGKAPYVVHLVRETETVTHLQLVISHIALDAWSARVVVDEILGDYEHTMRTGEPAALPGSSYLPLAERSRRFADERREADNAFFAGELAGVTPALFTRREQPGRRTSGAHSFTVDRSVVARILEAGISPTAYLAAVMNLLLCRIHRTDEVVLGLPVANRPTEEHRRVHGLFASVLPLHTRITEGMTMRELALGAKASIRTLRDYQHLSLGDVLRSLPSGTAPNQLFDVTLSSMRYPAPQEFPGATHSADYVTPVHDQDALSVFVYSYEGQDDLGVILDHALDVFDADLPIETFAESYRHLIEQGVEHFDRPLTELPSLPGPAAERVLTAGAGPVREFDREATLPALFRRTAAEAPEATALIAADGTRIGYAELDRATDRVAAGLRAEGVGPGDLVAVSLPRGPDLVLALLGTLKAGAAYVPVDPGYPAERVRFLLTDSEARIVLTEHGTVPDGVPAKRVRDVRELGSGTGATKNAAVPGPGPRDLAYVIYTSGSTGTPKGVQVEHRSVVNRLAWMQRAYPIGPGDVLLQKTPASFDVSVWELFWWAAQGASLALAAPGAERDPAQLLAAIERDGVTAVHFVPSMLGPFLDLLEASAENRERARSLRHVICSGEALPAARVEQFHRVLGGREQPPLLSNLYGPTEATVDVSAFDCLPGTTDDGVVPIGRPIDNIALHVLDPAQRPVPDGVPGELCIAGVGLARGYLNRPELTAERFVPNPAAPEERLYRTGDLARRLADGNLEYLGRLDRQVKIRGNRVELGEVENALMRVPGVSTAAVLDQEVTGRGRVLVAYYVSAAEQDAEDLRARLATMVPEFMLPAYFEPVPGIALTPNGKVDRAALPELSVRGGGGEYAEPRGAVETALAGVFAEVLAAGERVGARDNYYVLGGDSISALVVRARAAERGLHFSLSELMHNPTVAELAPHVRSETEHEDELAPFALVSAVDRPHLPDCVDAFGLTRLQLGMLYHSRQYRDSTLYHDVFRYSLRMPWQETEFRAAFARLTERHPALRSTFDLSGFSEPLQLVHAGVTDRLAVTDLRGQPAERAELAVAEHVEQRRTHRYESDLGPPYLLHAHLLADRVELVLSFHHALLDGGSVANLLTELFTDYRHAIGGLPLPRRQVLPSPAHHVRAEHGALESTVDRDYWRELLAGAVPAQLPNLASAAPAGPRPFTVRWATLPEGTERAVRSFADANRLPVKSVLFAAYAQTLWLLCGGREDLVTGMVTHNRPERAGGEQLAGLFLNTVPVRLAHDPASWLDTVRQAFAAERAGQPHRGYPLSAIIADNGGHTPFEAVFNYINFHGLAETFAGPELELLELDTVERTNFGLLVNVLTDPRDGRLRLRIDADPATVTGPQTELVERYFAEVLDRMLTEPEAAVDFGFLAPAPVPVTTPAAPLTDVVTRFREQAGRTPEATALVSGTRRWSYRELDQAVDRVARRLLAEGARPGEFTAGIAMDRSPELIAALLGVQRAGGACVPLDVSYPRPRLAAILRQAAPSWVLADRANTEVAGDTPVLLVPDLLAEPATEAATQAEPPGIELEYPAYVLFTSGSTGEPKGVVMPHRALANLVVWQERAPSAAVGETTLQYAPLGFDVSFQEILSTLCTGGTLCLVDEEQRRDMAELLRVIEDNAVARVFLPYVALQQLALTAQVRGQWPKTLRVVVSSGEALRVTEPIRALCSAVGGLVLENQYGPTETHVVTSHPMTGDPERFPDLPPIGRAVDGVDARVLDERLRPVPVGAVGSIHVAGLCLAEGYQGMPELTAERFPRDAEGTRLYRTGDLGVLTPDGTVVYLGRADRQVKVRGFRVEPAEVEKVIAAQAGITEVAVVDRRGAGEDTVLAAFLVGDQSAESTVDTSTVLAAVRAVLPEYLVPARAQWLDRLPRTPSGKRDDDALRRIPLHTKETKETDRPGDEYERTLVSILAELIDVPELGVHEDIFELGATSLTAMRLTTRVEQHYGVHLPLADLAQTPTVAGLAERLRGSRASSTFDPLVTLRAGGNRPPLFLVHPMGGGVLCYLPLARHLPEDLPFHALQAAGSEPGTEPVPVMREQAASYLAALRRVQPHGPYHLGGWSFGGFVAFEMARQLLAEGERVANLLVIDSTALNPDGYQGNADESMLNWFFWELLWMHRDADTRPEIPAGLHGFAAQTDYIAGEAVRLGVLPAGSSGAVIRRLFGLYRANLQATLDYRPEPLEAGITLLRSADDLPEVLRGMHDLMGTSYKSADNGWTRWSRNELTVVEVPGDHLSLMTEPHVRTLASIIDEQLGR